MIKLLILSGFIGIVCVKIHGMSFMKKLAVKIVMVYRMLGWVGLGFALLLFSMTELYEGKYGNSREERLLRVEREMGRGEMENAMQDMNVYKSYEADLNMPGRDAPCTGPITCTVCFPRLPQPIRHTLRRRNATGSRSCRSAMTATARRMNLM